MQPNPSASSGALRICSSRPCVSSLQGTNRDRIAAHFLTCFVALVNARLLAKLLRNRFAVGKIAESLAKASGSHMDENWYLFDYGDEVTTSVLENMGIDLGREFMGLGEIRELIGDTKKG